MLKSPLRGLRLPSTLLLLLLLTMVVVVVAGWITGPSSGHLGAVCEV